ncbi:MAG: ABC transporter permease [Acidobacteriota bacterium]
MRNVLTIARKELGSYFASPIAYIFLAIAAVIFGFFFYSIVAMYVSRALQVARFGGMPPGMNINEMIFRPLLMNVAVTSLFLTPMLTMRLYSEERKSGTLELLLTAPVSDWEILLGKFLGALTLYGGLILLVLLYFGLLFIYGNPNLKPLLPGVLGLVFFGGSLISLGMLFSTFTNNQIIAGSLTFGLFLLLWVLNWTSVYSTGTVSQVLSYLSVTTHLENFPKGVLDLSDCVYYLSLISLGLFLTARSMEASKGRP